MAPLLEESMAMGTTKVRTIRWCLLLSIMLLLNPCVSLKYSKNGHSTTLRCKVLGTLSRVEVLPRCLESVISLASSAPNADSGDGNALKNLLKLTPTELLKFNGQTQTRDGSRIYLSVKGVVFDVTKAQEMYGKDGPYELFSGHDVSGNLAKMNFEQSELDRPNIENEEKLNPLQQGSLDAWIDNFLNIKMYPVVGYLVGDNGSLMNKQSISIIESAQKYGSSNSESLLSLQASPLSAFLSTDTNRAAAFLAQETKKKKEKRDHFSVTEIVGKGLVVALWPLLAILRFLKATLRIITKFVLTLSFKISNNKKNL